MLATVGRSAELSHVGAAAAGGRSFAALEVGQVRAALARDLHDSVARTLLVMLLELETFKVDQHGRNGVLRQVDVFEDFVRSALGDVRRVLRELNDEPDLADGLLVGLRQILVPTFEHSYRIPVTLTYSGRLQDGLRPDVELTVYRVAQEALVNVGRHSGASSASLHLVQTRSAVLLEVVDDGRGFDVPSETGFGTRGMRERAILVGGRLSISSRPGEGTRLKLRVPLQPGGAQRLRAAG